MSDQSNPNFIKIYWYIILITALTFGYAVGVTFWTVPEKNQQTVSVIMGFLLGTLLSSGAGYLLGGNPVAQSFRKSAEGTTTANISADITTTPVEKKDEEIKTN